MTTNELADAKRSIVLVLTRDELHQLRQAAHARVEDLYASVEALPGTNASAMAARHAAADVQSLAVRLGFASLAADGDALPEAMPLASMVAMADVLHGQLVRKQREAIHEDDDAGGHFRAMLDNAVEAARGVRGYVATQWWTTESPAAMQSPGAALYVQVKAIADDDGVTKNVAEMAQLILDKPEQLEEADAQARVESLLLGSIRRKCEASKPVSFDAEGNPIGFARMHVDAHPVDYMGIPDGWLLVLDNVQRMCEWVDSILRYDVLHHRSDPALLHAAWVEAGWEGAYRLMQDGDDPFDPLEYGDYGDVGRVPAPEESMERRAGAYGEVVAAYNRLAADEGRT